MSDGQRRTEIGQFGDVLANRIVQRQLAVARQECDRCCSELLRHRPGLEDGVGRDRSVVLEVGAAIRRANHRFAANIGRYCASGSG